MVDPPGATYSSTKVSNVLLGPRFPSPPALLRPPPPKQLLLVQPSLPLSIPLPKSLPVPAEGYARPRRSLCNPLPTRARRSPSCTSETSKQPSRACRRGGKAPQLDGRTAAGGRAAAETAQPWTGDDQPAQRGGAWEGAPHHLGEPRLQALCRL